MFQGSVGIKLLESHHVPNSVSGRFLFAEVLSMVVSGSPKSCVINLNTLRYSNDTVSGSVYLGEGLLLDVTQMDT